MGTALSHRTALFALNYPAQTGYAWNTIEQVLLAVILRLRLGGWNALVCRPPAEGNRDDAFAKAGIRVIPFDFAATRRGSLPLIRFCRLLRAEHVRLLYLTDQPTRSLRYPLFRATGVRHIVVHDRTSGARSLRSPSVRWLKRSLHRIPGLAADRFIGVSDFVVQRLIEVNGVPPSRAVRVYNGIDLSRFEGGERSALQKRLGLPESTPVIFAGARAMPYKGIPVLLQAARLLCQTHPGTHFAYAGDGPALDAFRREAGALGLKTFHFLGHQPNPAELLNSATLAVVPSTWAEAFGLTVVEAMAAGLPVVASRVGGIPELIEEGITGVLVPPGEPAALARAIGALLDDPALRARIGSRARAVAAERFPHTRVAEELLAVLQSLGGGNERVT